MVYFDMTYGVCPAFQHQSEVVGEPFCAESRFRGRASHEPEDGGARMENMSHSSAGHHDIGGAAAVNRLFGVLESIDREERQVQPAVPRFIEEDVFLAGTEEWGVESEKFVELQTHSFD